MNSIEKEKTNKIKWLKAKDLLSEKVSLITSANIIKDNKITNNLSLTLKTFETEILIKIIQEKSTKILLEEKEGDEKIPKIVVKDANDNVTYIDEVTKFLFEIRNNYNLMWEIIDKIPEKSHKKISFLISQFFYENIYSESSIHPGLINLIYFLFEKEISDLNIISFNKFLSSSFLSKLIDDIKFNYEIRTYLHSTIDSMIKNLEKINPEYYDMDLLKKEENLKYFEDFISLNENNSRNLSEQNKKKVMCCNAFNIGKSEVEEEEKDQESYNSIISFNLGYQELLNYYNQKDLSEFQKTYIHKMYNYLICIKNTSIFSNDELLSQINSNSNITDDKLISYWSGYELITTFIEALFENLNNTTIIPYFIRFICKIIYILIQKKFENISQLDRNCFVCKFFFSKLIFPVLLNPDKGIVCDSCIISEGTRKNLINVYTVLSKFVFADFFTSDKEMNMTIFNKYFIDHIEMINNFVEKIIDVEIPSYITNLINSCDMAEGINFKERNKSLEFAYFDVFPDDFLYNQTICFCYDDIYTLIEAAEETDYIKEEKCSKDFKMIFNKLSDFKERFLVSNETAENERVIEYYVLMKDELNNEAKEFLKNNETKYELKSNAESDNLKEIIFCLSEILSNISFIYGTDWSSTDSTMECFTKINEYLKNNNDNRSIPLYWYSEYLLENLGKVEKKYQENDYQLLYEKCIEDIQNGISYYQDVLNFYSYKMGRKVFFLEQKYKNYIEDLKMTINSYINTKTFNFIIKYYSLLKFTNWNFSGVSHYDLKEFIKKFSGIKDIEKIIFLKKEEEMNNPKEILNEFMQQVQKKIEANNILSYLFSNDNENVFALLCDMYGKAEAEKQEKEEDTKNKIINNLNNKILATVWNYVLKWFFIRKSKEKMDDSITKEEGSFYDICVQMQKVDPVEDLKIPKEIVNKTILNEIITDIIYMDHCKGPQDKFDAFGEAINKMASLFYFSLLKDRPEAGDFIPLITYCVICAKPKNLYFTILFLSYFLTQTQKMGKDGYNQIQLESAMMYVKNMYKKNLNK